MPRITVHGGPSNAADLPPEPPAEPAAAEPEVPEVGELDADDTQREAPGIQRPARSASKADWVAFANAINQLGVVDERDPESLTKAQLIELYGELGEE